MANGLSDILSVYRQSLASERQSRQSEMQIALQAMQFETAQQFREEGRQREDIMGALEFASQSTKEALGQDASQIYSKILNLSPILEANWDDETGGLEKSNRIIKKLKKIGYSAQDATDVVNIANTYGLASKNPALAQAAQSMASDFGKRVSRDYSVWKDSGFASNTKGYQPKSPLMKAMEKSGLMYKGGDQLQRDMSIDAFIGVGDALTALDNIEQERLEVGSGDYSIDRPISVGENFQSDIGGTDFASLVDEAGVSLGMGGGKEGGLNVELQNEISAGVELEGISQGEYGVGVVSDEDIMEKLDFLPQTDQEKIEKQLVDLNETIANKMVSLDSLYTERDDRVSEYNLMEGERDKFKARREYFYKLEGREGQNYNDATKDLFALERKMDSSVEAKEARVSTGYRSGTMGRGNLGEGVFGENPEYENTYTKDIIKLSQEIEDLNRKKMNFAPR